MEEEAVARGKNVDASRKSGEEIEFEKKFINAGDKARCSMLY